MGRTAIPMPDRAVDVFNFIVEFKAKHDGVAPSLQEIIAHTNITSQSLVRTYLFKLQAAGRVELILNQSGHMTPRGIIVCGGSWRPPAQLQLSV